MLLVQGGWRGGGSASIKFEVKFEFKRDSSKRRSGLELLQHRQLQRVGWLGEYWQKEQPESFQWISCVSNPWGAKRD